ncbi:MqnA/MqnD/SBP family protein, partial [Vibrio parahaemolyticus]
ETLHIPIPLGGIVAHKRIDKAIVQKLDQLIKKSIEYAYLHYPHISEYVKMHSQEMSESVMRQHIDLYVNKYSLDLG